VKALVVILAAAAAYPVGRWLRDRPPLQLLAWTLVGLLPFVSSLDLALLSFGARPGDTHGYEVALIDWLVVTLAFARRGPARPLPFRLVLGAYFLAVLLAASQAAWPLGSLGYAWKLVRMYLLFAVIGRADDAVRAPGALLRGMMLGVLYECLWSVWQHFGLGVPRVSGTFAHGNTLGMLVNLAVMAPMALILAGRVTRLTALSPIAALPTCLLTVSRGTVLLFGAGAVLVYVASTIRSRTPRKAWIGVLGVGLAAILVPLAASTLGTRTRSEFAGSDRVRSQYERAAAMMLADHPLGVGPNQFTLMMLTGGYGDRGGVEWSQRVAIVHNVYWLTAAEMGYPGLAALVLLFLGPLLVAFRDGLVGPRDRRRDLLIGLGAGLTVLYVHGFFEWAWRDTAVSYLYWMILGVIASLSRQVREEQPRRAPAPLVHFATGFSPARP
jgi:O-antigen ligase